MRKVVYHKNYDRTASESERNHHSKVVSSDEELKKLGPDWGDHPSEKKAEKAVKVEEQPEAPAQKPAKVKKAEKAV